jgi:nucleoside-diphosphate-sugar epimerase
VQVRTVIADREGEEKADTFGARIRDLKPDIVVDMICFTLASAQHLAQALRGNVRHFLHTGTIWVHGPSAVVPTTEMQPRTPFGAYGVQKAAIEAYLLDEARRGAFRRRSSIPVTSSARAGRR